MFDQIGKKIKVLATVLAILGIIASIYFGGSLIAEASSSPSSSYYSSYYYSSYPSSTSKTEVVIGVIIMVGGSLVSWISAFVLYGFGELIEKVCIIEERLSLHPQMKASDERYGNSDDEQMKTGERIVASQKDLDEMLKKGIITEEEYREATKRE